MNVLKKLEINPKYANIVNPPKSWFEEKPEWWGDIPGNKLWVDDEGRVAGLVCNWDQCIIDGSDECWIPERLPDDYDYAYQNNITFDSGDVGEVAVLAATTGHGIFDDPQHSLEFNQGKRGEDGRLFNDMDQFANRIMAVRFHNSDEGLLMLGALYPHVGDYVVELVRGSAVSGHWQHIVGSGEDYSFLGAVFVNKPGLPLKKVASSVLPSNYFLGFQNITDVDDRLDVMEKVCSCEKGVSMEQNVDIVEEAEVAAVDSTPVEDSTDAVADGEDTVNALQELTDMLTAVMERVAVLEEIVAPMADQAMFGE